MNTVEDILLRLRVDDRSLHDDATEGGLDMSAGAAEAVIQVHVTEGRVEIVLKKSVDDTAANPDAFWIAGRTGHLLGDFGEVVKPVLRFFLGLLCRLLLRLVGLFVLGQSRSDTDQRGNAKGGQGLRQAKWHDDDEIPSRMCAYWRLNCAVYIGFRPQCGLDPIA